MVLKRAAEKRRFWTSISSVRCVWVALWGTPQREIFRPQGNFSENSPTTTSGAETESRIVSSMPTSPTLLHVSLPPEGSQRSKRPWGLRTHFDAYNTIRFPSSPPHFPTRHRSWRIREVGPWGVAICARRLGAYRGETQSSSIVRGSGGAHQHRKGERGLQEFNFLNFPPSSEPWPKQVVPVLPFRAISAQVERAVKMGKLKK